MVMFGEKCSDRSIGMSYTLVLYVRFTRISHSFLARHKGQHSISGFDLVLTTPCGWSDVTVDDGIWESPSSAIRWWHLVPGTTILDDDADVNTF